MMVHGNHCDMFNLKIGKQGGIYESTKIIEIAEKNNIPMQVGGFIESRIIFTVNCHLGHTSNFIKYFVNLRLILPFKGGRAQWVSRAKWVTFCYILPKIHIQFDLFSVIIEIYHVAIVSYRIFQVRVFPSHFMTLRVKAAEHTITKIQI